MTHEDISINETIPHGNNLELVFRYEVVGINQKTGEEKPKKFRITIGDDSKTDNPDLQDQYAYMVLLSSIHEHFPYIEGWDEEEVEASAVFISKKMEPEE
jgi:hypothetical protein